jgi:hypothetical protein
MLERLKSFIPEIFLSALRGGFKLAEVIKNYFEKYPGRIRQIAIDKMGSVRVQTLGDDHLETPMSNPELIELKDFYDSLVKERASLGPEKKFNRKGTCMSLEYYMTFSGNKLFEPYM